MYGFEEGIIGSAMIRHYLQLEEGNVPFQDRRSLHKPWGGTNMRWPASSSSSVTLNSSFLYLTTFIFHEKQGQISQNIWRKNVPDVYLSNISWNYLCKNGLLYSKIVVKYDKIVQRKLLQRKIHTNYVSI